jgi:iron complex transport system substrate-binding protein
MRFRVLSLALVVALGTAACGGDDDDAASDAGSTSTEGQSDTFPVTITAANGDVTIDERPARIVSLSPTATEMLFAIGAGDQVVAVDDQSDHPAEVPATNLSGFEPNVEAIASYEPDLVVMSDDAIAGELEALDIRLLVEPAVSTVEEAYEQVRQLGAATGNATEADATVSGIQSEIEAIVTEIPEDADAAPLTFYHELDDSYYSATSSTFIGALYELAGLENIADEADDGSGYPQLSGEYIVDADPDIVYLADSECCAQSAETVAARPGWGEISAVQNGNVVELGDDVASRWGPRMVELLELIVEGADRARAST